MNTNLDLDSSLEQSMSQLVDDQGGLTSGAGGTPSAVQGSEGSGGNSAPVPAGTATPTAQPWDTPPTSWRKETHASYAQMPADLRQYIHEREQQALSGIRQYKSEAERWNSIYAPYKELLAQHKVDPTNVTKSLLEAHMALTMGKPEDRQRWAQYIVEQYKLKDLLQQESGTPNPLEGTVKTLETRLQRFEQLQYEAAVAKNTEAVAAFVADKNNEFAEMLLPDMGQLIQTGQAADLKSAYEMAQWLNPTVRAQLLDRAVTKANTAPAIPATPKPSSGAPATGPAVPAKKAATLDEAMDNVASEIFSKQR